MSPGLSLRLLGLACALAGTVLAGGGLAAETRQERFTGRAIVSATGAHFYTEHHLHTWSGNKIQKSYVRYLAPDGSLLAVRSSDFRANPLAPASVFDLKKEGRVERVAPRGKSSFLVSVRATGQAPRSKTLRVPAPAVAGQGLVAFLVGKWGQLATGQPAHFHYIVPGRLAYYRFRLKRTGPTTLRGRSASRFTLGLAGVLGAVLPDVEFVYDDATKRLLRYRGPSAIKGDFDDPPAIQVDFTYP